MPRHKKEKQLQRLDQRAPVAAGPMTAETLISQAIAKGTPVETLERLLAMRKELRAEQAKDAFDKAMAAFQFECPVIVKTKAVKTKSGVVAYKFAPIDSIITQAKPFIQKHGFSYSSNMEIVKNGEETQIKVKIKVTHAAGHSELTEMTVPLGNKTDIMSQTQVVAAAQTFAKRYAFVNAFGILTSDEDNENLLKDKEEKQSLPKDAVTKINKAKTHEELVAICKTLTDANPKLRTLLIEEYTRRKNELSDELADQADANLSKAGGAGGNVGGGQGGDGNAR